MVNEFDSYAPGYREVINSACCVSGEDYDFFIRFRIARMKRKLIMDGVNIKDLRIFDLGCGIGVAERILREQFNDAIIVGADLSCKSLMQAIRQGLSHAGFICASGDALPLNDGSIDLIYCNGVFHHTPAENRLKVLRELYRILKPDGQVFISENNPANPLMMQAMAKNPFDSNVLAIRPRDLAMLVKQSGFSHLKIFYYFWFPHWLRFLRWSEPILEWLPFGAQYFVWAKRVNIK
jgi:ubiquinone/menaquinone biosynthesis C-methylase UbiE